MSVQISPVYTGTTANDGTGDTLQNAFIKVNNSFSNVATAVNVLQNEINGTTALPGSLYLTNGTIYINGSAVSTAAGSFPGGNVALQANFQAATTSTSTATGAVVITGGLGVGGNIYANTIYSPTIGNTGAAITGATVTASTSVTTPTVTATTSVTTPTVTATTVNASTIGNTGAVHTGSTGTFTTSVTTPTVTATTVNAATIGNASAVLYGTLNSSSASQPNITTLTGVITLGTLGLNTSFPGNVSIGNLTVTGATITSTSATSTGQFSPSANLNATYTLGNVTNWWYTGYIGTGNFNTINVNSGGIVPGSNVAVNSGANPSNWWNNIYAATGNFNTININSGGIVPGSNLNVNLGSTSAWYNNIYGNTFVGRSTSALYADLAENYLTDQVYESGTVIVVGGAAEVTACNSHGQDSVIGVVSTNPAYLMNSSAPGQAIALKGRVPVKVFGPIQKGQRLSTSHCLGHAEYAAGAYSFAIALETDIGPGTKIIEAIIL